MIDVSSEHKNAKGVNKIVVVKIGHNKYTESMNSKNV